MPKCQVEVTCRKTFTKIFILDADSEEEAEELALDEALEEDRTEWDEVGTDSLSAECQSFNGTILGEPR